MDERGRSTVTDPGSNELLLTRTFNAPRELVFKAWTKPEQIAQWWGPRGFTNPLCQVDARPGGYIRIDMKGPDGVVYPMTGQFQEVVPPSRLVFTSEALEGPSGKAFFEVRTTVTFDEKDGTTVLTLHAVVLWTTPQAAAALAGMKEGWTQSLDKLSEYVAHV